jgi:post-segregation antitoxin (ccd killing protein)
MAKVTIYMPDELLVAAKDAGLNISGLAQHAVRVALRSAKTDAWLEELRRCPRSTVRSEDVDRTLREVRDRWGA